MTNLKKTLAVVLAFAMVLSMGLTSFAAYSDVADGTKVSEAVDILSNLGILTGFEDGTFRPDETVTRAQMAAIVCRVLGYEDQAQSSVGSTVFSDVAADHWASGYINVAQSLQIINGYPDGTYLPEKTVAYEEAVKMIVVALGYELAAQAKGGWSTGYLAIASAEGITKAANGTVGSPAARSTVAILVYNSLEVRLMDQDTWTTTGQDDEYTKTNDTILSKYLEVQKWEGIVTATPYAQFADEGYAADKTPEFSLDANAFYQEYAGGTLRKYTRTGETYAWAYAPYEVNASLVDVNTLAGKKVIAYIGEEEDDETGDRMVYAIAEKQSANKVTKVGLNQLVEEGDKYWEEDGVVGYKNVGSSKAIDLDLDDAVSLILNFEMVDSDIIADAEGDDLVSVNTTAELVAEVGTNGTVEFISNDNDSKIDVIIVTAYTGEAVVEEVSTEDGIITFDMHHNDGDTNVVEEIDTEDEDLLVIVYKDGVLATVNDIAANDTISAVDTDNDFMVLFVSSKTVTGSVESYDDETVTIGGEDYKLSIAYDSTTALKDKEGIFFINVAGQIAWDEAEATKGNYGVVIAVGTGSGVKGGYEAEVALADGTVAVYSLATKAYVESASGTLLSDDKTDEDVYAYLLEQMSDTVLVDDNDDADPENDVYEKTGRALEADLDDLIFEVKIKNGSVSKLKLVAVEAAESGEEYDEENMAYGNALFDDSTIVFSVDANGGAVEDDDIKVGKVADFFVDGEGKSSVTVHAIDVDDNDEIAGAVLGFGLDVTVPLDGDAMVITGIKSITYNDDDAVYLTGFQGGKEVAYTLYDEDETFSTSAFSKGDVILVGAANAEGVISAYKSLLTKSVVDTEGEGDDAVDIYGYVLGADADADADKEIEYYVGQVDYSNAPTDSSFTIGDDDATITMKSTANYTLVGFSEGSTPEVSKKSKGKSIFGNSSKYESVAFVRYYDDKLAEVIVYRWSVDATNEVYDNTAFDTALIADLAD